MLEDSVQPVHWECEPLTEANFEQPRMTTNYGYPLIPLCAFGKNSLDVMDLCDQFQTMPSLRPDCYTFNGNKTDPKVITQLGTQHGISLLLDTYYGNDIVSFCW